MELTLHKEQDKVLDSSARFIGVVSGVRGGKTTIGAIWLLNEINQHRLAGKYGDYLICAPTNKILDQSTLPKFKEFFPKDWGIWKEQKSCFELTWFRPGSTEPCRIYVRSMDEPDSIEGMEALAAWADEVGKMKSSAWINMQGRLAITKGRCLLTTTPYVINWFYEDIVKKAKEGDKDYCLITWSSSANPAFPKDEFERAKATLPKAIFERRYLGKWTKLEGLVYAEFDEDIHVIEPFAVPDTWLRFGGLDFGYNNPNALISIAQDPNTNTFYITSEFYQNETLLKTLSEAIKSKRLQYVLADTHDSQLINELNKFHGCGNVKEADKSVTVGIERIRTLLVEERLKFFRGKTTKTIEEIQEYHYRPSTEMGGDSEKPVGKKNHAMDALRYAFSRPLQGLYAQRPANIQRQRYSRRIPQTTEYTGY